MLENNSQQEHGNEIEPRVLLDIKQEVLNGDIEKAREMIQTYACQNTPVNEDKENLLTYYICMTQNNKNAFYQNLYTALIPETDRKKRLSMLLDIGSSPLYKSSLGQVAAYYAVRYNDLLAMRLILSSLNNENLHILQEHRSSNGDTLLHTAVRHASAPMIKLLLAYEFNPNAQNKERDTPLHLLSIRHDTAAANAFFNVPNAIKPDLTIRNRNGKTADQECVFLKDLFTILNRARRKSLLIRRKMSYRERVLHDSKKQARENIRFLKRQREHMKRMGSMENI